MEAKTTRVPTLPTSVRCRPLWIVGECLPLDDVLLPLRCFLASDSTTDGLLRSLGTHPLDVEITIPLSVPVGFFEWP